MGVREITQNDFKFDDENKVLEVCGVKYAYELFEAFGINGLEVNTLFALTSRQKDGAIEITSYAGMKKKVYEKD